MTTYDDVVNLIKDFPIKAPVRSLEFHCHRDVLEALDNALIVCGLSVSNMTSLYGMPIVIEEDYAFGQWQVRDQFSEVVMEGNLHGSR